MEHLYFLLFQIKNKKLKFPKIQKVWVVGRDFAIVIMILLYLIIVNYQMQIG